MIKHFLKIALRNLRRQKVLATINIAGLSLGLACFILFLLYAVNEFSFDRFHKNAGDIYRVYRWTEAMQGHEASGDVYLPMPLGPALKQEFPDVANTVRMREPWGENFVRVNGKTTGMQLSFADPVFFSVFSFPLKTGNPQTVLNDLHNIVLTEATAKQLFGSENPVGKTVEIKMDETFEPFVVTGIAKDIPSNSSITFSLLGNFDFLATTRRGKRSVDNWNRSAYFTFVQTKPGSTLPTDPQRLLSFRQKYYPNEEKELREAGYWKADGPPVIYGMQSLRSIHTDTKISGGNIAPVKPTTIWILLSIAFAVLLIACINFTTLAIGRSAGRAREIGIRKVVGSRRKQLAGQFIAEALLLTVIAVCIGLLLGNWLLPWFNGLSGRELQFSFSQFPEMIGLLAALTLVVGLLAGSYPAFVLSGFNPIQVLKQKLKVGGSNLFTKSLVTLQFVLSIGLIAATLIILQQIHFMTGTHPGFNKENIIVIDADGANTKKVYPLFKQAVTSNAQVAGIAGAELGLGAGTGWSRSGFDYKGEMKAVYEYYVDADYIPLLNVQLLKGRNFDNRIAGDTVTSVIINEAMIKDFGWTIENAVGQKLEGYSERFTPEVIGVVKDFNFRPLKEEVKPQLFHQFADYAPYKFFVKIKPGNPAGVLSLMESNWNTLVPELPFRYSFLDEDLDRFYRAEVRWSRIIGWAGGISIFLACLGLFGLAALSVVNRTKEIGIRKVLGASLAGIIGLLSKDFLKLVLIALLIAAPLAWYFMHNWLQDFAYRISIGWWIFGLAGFLSLFIAFFTIGIQAIRAGKKNPVAALRTE